MRSITASCLIYAALATSAQAQVADRLSRRIEPNAIDRAITASRAYPDLSAQAQADRVRAEQAARDAAARRGPPPSSTTVDGPSGLQRLGAGTASPSAPVAPPVPQP